MVLDGQQGEELALEAFSGVPKPREFNILVTFSDMGDIDALLFFFRFGDLILVVKQAGFILNFLN